MVIYTNFTPLALDLEIGQPSAEMAQTMVQSELTCLHSCSSVRAAGPFSIPSAHSLQFRWRVRSPGTATFTCTLRTFDFDYFCAVYQTNATPPSLPTCEGMLTRLLDEPASECGPRGQIQLALCLSLVIKVRITNNYCGSLAHPSP